MCEFISWKKDSQGSVFFLTDNEVFSPHGRETLKDTKDNDYIGHGAIDAFFGSATHNLSQFENQNFWDNTPFPPQIAVHLESPQTLLDTWGKILRESLQPNDAYYILTHAPQPWRSALMDICLRHVTKDSRYSYCTLRDVKNLTEQQTDTLIKGITKNSSYSYYTLRDVKNLTEQQINILIKGITKNSSYSYCTLRYVKNLTQTQIALLKKSSRWND